MAELSVSKLCEILTGEKFDEDVVESFRKNKIDGETFLELDHDDLKELGIIALGDRKKVKKLQQRLKDRDEQATLAEPPQPPIPQMGPRPPSSADSQGPAAQKSPGPPSSADSQGPATQKSPGPPSSADSQGSAAQKSPGPPSSADSQGPAAQKSPGPPSSADSQGPAAQKSPGPPSSADSQGPAAQKSPGPPSSADSQGPAVQKSPGPPSSADSQGPAAKKGPGPPSSADSQGPAAQKSPGPPSSADSQGPAAQKGPGPPSSADSQGPAAQKSPGPPSSADSQGPATQKSPGPRSSADSQGPAAQKSPGPPSLADSQGPQRPAAQTSPGSPSSADSQGPQRSDAQTHSQLPSSADSQCPQRPAALPPIAETQSQQSLSEQPLQPPSSASHGTKSEKVKGNQYQTRFKQDGPPPSGLSIPPPKCSVKVVFHALVPQDVWQLNTQSHMYIRLGKASLGAWTYDCGEFERKRSRTVAQQQVYEMTCELSIDASLLERQQAIPYKYVIYSPRMVEDNDCWEYLHGVSGQGIVNRCLIIPTKEFKRSSSGGVYHQYDTMVYPSKRDKSQKYWQKYWQRFKASLPFSGSEQVPTPDTMRKDCLNFYLTKSQELLTEGNLPPQCDISHFIGNIEHIYNHMKVQVTIGKAGSSPDETENRSLKVAMKEWLLSITKTLKDQRGSLDHGKILVSASVVAYLLKMVQDQKVAIGADDVGALLELLQVEPEQKSCPDFEYLCSVSSEQFRLVIAQAIVGLCNYLIAQKQYTNTTWLTALPFYHFLKGIQPFSTPQLDPQKLTWADKDLNINPLKMSALKISGFVKQHYHQFQHLFKADPMLMPVLIEVCPKQDLPELLGKISPYLTATWLAKKTKELDLIEIKGGVETVQQSLQKLLNKDYKSIEELQANVEAALFLLGELLKRLKGSHDEVELLKSSLSLLFSTLWQLSSLVPDNDESKKIVANTRLKVFLKVKGFLKNWVADRNVIGGSIFGWTIDRQCRGGLAKDTKEIQLWKLLLPLDCPDSLKEDWRLIVHDLVRDRVNEVPKNSNLQVRLFCTLASTGETDALLSNIFVDAAMLSLGGFMTIEGIEAIQNVERLYSVQSKEVGKLLGHMIEKRYPDSKEAVPFRELLQWDLWPSLIRIYSTAKASSSIIIQGLPPNVDQLCYCTQSSFNTICRKLISGDVSFADLEEISKRQEQMEKLCAATLPTNTDGEMHSHSQTAEIVAKAVQKRLTELYSFKSHRTQLGTLYSTIPDDVVVEGIEQLRQCVQLDADISQKSIKYLWVPQAIFPDAQPGSPPSETQQTGQLIAIPPNVTAGSPPSETQQTGQLIAIPPNVTAGSPPSETQQTDQLIAIPPNVTAGSPPSETQQTDQLIAIPPNVTAGSPPSETQQTGQLIAIPPNVTAGSPPSETQQTGQLIAIPPNVTAGSPPSETQQTGQLIAIPPNVTAGSPPSETQQTGQLIAIPPNVTAGSPPSETQQTGQLIAIPPNVTAGSPPSETQQTGQLIAIPPNVTAGSPPSETQQTGQLDAPLVPILEPFYCLAGKYSTNFFHNTWKAKLRSAGKNVPLSLDQVKNVWEQTVIECVQVLSSMADYTLKLHEVDSRFIAYQDTVPELSTELKNFADGVISCKDLVENSKIPGHDVIDERVHFIQRYWELRNHASAADILLKLQNCLKLQGDFRPVEKISSQVTDSLNDATLESIKELLQHTAAARFLKGIASHRERRKCLESFAECMNLVDWIRKLEGGVQGIQKFVTVAIGTGAGGEGDLQHDKLSKLRTVSSGFESLIFRLPKDAGYQTLVERCESLWQALKQTPSLPTLLETCRRNLDWYEGVKMAQGSVEVTSFSLMKVINGNGLYTIGSFDSTINRSLQDVIHLELSETDKHTTQATYALDELRDLESKLVLITGSESEGDLRDGVEQYTQTLHIATRIAHVLIDLQQAGHVNYIGWAMTFHSKNFKVDKLERLQAEAKEMEHELDNWKKEVERARKHFYDLNCFTTLQLLVLRKELGKFNKQLFTESNVSPHALTLLQCLSPEISNGHIKPAVENITSVLPKLVPQLSIEAPSISIPPPEEKKDQATNETSDVKPDIVQKSEEVESTDDHHSSRDEASESDEEIKLVPNLKSSLNGSQRFVLDKLVGTMGYNEQFVLKGLQNLSIDDSSDKYTLKDEVLEWCEANKHAEESVPDHSDDEESEDSSQESDYEEYTRVVAVDAAPETVPPSVSADEPATKQPQHETASSKVEVIRRLPVGEHHPLVIELQQKVKFPVQDCIKAVRFCGEDREAAEDYLLATADKGELFLSDSGGVAADSEKLSFMGGYGVPKEIGSSEGVMVVYQPDAGAHYLNLQELAATLWQLSSSLPGAVSCQRPFKSLKSGSPNLIVTSPSNMLRTTLALYMEDPSLPLPTQEEVLICTPETTQEEVTLLWRRAINDPDHKRIFCLVHPEKLPFQVSDRALRTLSELSQGKRGYRLAIICCDDDGRSQFVSKLHHCRKPYAAVKDVSQYQDYLKRHFVYNSQSAPITFSQNIKVLASDTDFEGSCVRVVSSTQSGMGKSLYVRRMAEKLQKIKKEKGVSGRDHIIIPVHGPRATADVVMDFLHTPECLSESACAILHFDIAPSILSQVDTILFSLLILRGLSDSQGRVWKSYPTQLYAVEARVPDNQSGSETAKHKNILSFLELLPTVECISPQKVLQMLQSGNKDPRHILKANRKVLMDEEIYQKPEYQRVHQYLRRYHSKMDLDNFVYDESSKHLISSPAECLEVILPQLENIHGSGHRLSWCEVWHFVSFLNQQLKCSELSVFCFEASMEGSVLAGLKNFVVKFMIQMSQDFAISSLEESSQVDETRFLQVDKNKLWTKNFHSYLFFNDDGQTFTFIGFAVNDRGDSYDPKTKDIVDKQFMPKSLYDGLTTQGVNLKGDYDGNKDAVIRKLGAVMGHFWVLDKRLAAVEDPDPSYVLTVDNVIKMLAIRMRFRCGIPVIIMGETGCGKTRLIRYMCDLDAHLAKSQEARNNMLVLKVHGGTTEEDIIQKVHEAEKEALKNKECNLTTVLFLDEANTTEHIGLIKEIMCDRKLHGKPISDDVQIIAACNPYRMHTHEMISKLESAGLGFYVKDKEAQESLDEIPLRHLVYRVHDLPPSMRSLVYDFGQLSTVTEEDYTRQIVKNQVTRNAELCMETNLIETLTTLLVCSQQYMKDQKDECSFVSLRDVVRTMIVFEYFYTKMIHFEEAAMEARKDDQSQVPITVTDKTTRAIILALGVCYHARLEKRDAYEKKIVAAFKYPLHLPGPDLDDKVEQFRNEIRWCQSVLLHNMNLPENVARNTALRENVFMMTICIELRIPLFLVGKPGSSKSLAKSIVTDSLLGQSSSSALLKQFKHVTMISHQCSQLSTPEGVIEVFKTAQLYQKGDTVSVVVLDEVGLAEDSPSLPLKVLHPLLEDGTEHAVRSDEIIEREKRVAFIGISNWALDPAKMNRGVMVIRGDPDIQELIQSAEGICSNEVNDPVKERLSTYFGKLAAAYQEIYRKQKELDELHRKEFYGLRDFYSLIKMLYWMCKEAGQPLNWWQMKHAILRNFGGIAETSTFQPLEVFKKVVSNRSKPILDNFKLELRGILKPDCSPLGLIETSLMSRERSWHGENRYLLFLTENYSALQILDHYLHGAVTLTTAPGQEDKRMEPFVLFGSSFPKDKEYTQVCRNINRVKICMETGRMVILLNLENLYESLYDLLNQYYIKLDEESRYVDLGLQTHRVKCRVHNNFKLILIAEKETVFERFPIPLINRLEKHQVLTSTVLSKPQKEVLKRLIVWIDQFTKVTESSGSDQNFREGDAFVGFQKDTPAAVIFHATHVLKAKEKSITDEQKEEIYKLSQELLLQTATPDAVVRTSKTELKPECKEMSTIYFNQQKHSSLEEFLRHQICDQKQGEGLFMQVTTHSHLLSSGEIEQLTASLGLDEKHVSWALLQEFDTELDFSNKVGPVFHRDGLCDGKDSLLIIQCDSGHLNVDLIACARYRVQDEKPKRVTISEDGDVHHGATHVLFVINLPRKAAGSSFVGFQGGQWISTHIDNLHSITSLTLADAMSKPISALFYDPENEHGVHQCSRLHGCIQAAASHLRDAGHMEGRTTERVAILLALFPQELHFPLSDSTFFGAVVKHIHTLLQERPEGVYEEDWVVGEAMSASKLQNGGTFLNTLARKLDDIVIPLLSEILGFIDRSYNMDLIDPQDQDSPLSQFWLKMFSNPQICQFRYSATRSTEEVPGSRSRLSVQDFKAKMPFSWLIKTVVDGAWDTAPTNAGNSTIELCSTLCTLVSETLIGEVLSSVDDPAVIEDFYYHYLNDYTRMEHKSLLQKANYSEMEYRLVIRALDGVVHSEELSRAGLETLTSMVTAVHVAFHKIEEELFWFGQLVCHNPEILSPLLKQERKYKTEMTLHLEAAMAALESLDPGPPLESSHDKAIQSWLHTIYNSQNAIDSILTSDSAHGNELTTKAKLQWNLIQVVQMFAEHVVLKHENMTQFACRLKGLLELTAFQDFTKAKAVNRLKTALNNLDGDFKKQFKDRKVLAAIRKDIYAFFMETVSRLCFGQETPPEPAVVKELIESVFTEKQGKLETRESLLQSGKEDKVPVIRSFLLQLLLQHNTNEVRDHLREYFQKCRQLCPAQQSSADRGIDQILCLLCVKCFEDVHHKSIRCTLFRDQIAQGLRLLTLGYEALRNQIGHAESDSSVEFLEGVAQVRFALSIVAELLNRRVSSSREDQDASMLEYGADATSIIAIAREACVDEEINALESGPLLYLFKLIVRQYGLTCLNNLIELRDLSWILPPELWGKDGSEDEITTPDPFLLYEVYTDICQLLADQNLDTLNQSMKDISSNPQGCVALLLALYCKVTISQTSLTEEITDDFLDGLCKFTEETPSSLELKAAWLALIGNSLVGPLRPSTGHDLLHKSLACVVVHAGAVFLSQQENGLLQPFVKMVTNPDELAGAYLPTLPIDPVDERLEFTAALRKSGVDSSGQFYVCPNRHLYFIGNCGRPFTESNCIVCGASIGGTGHNLTAGKLAGTTDTTAIGYDLGLPQYRGTNPFSERKLSPASCAIMRFLMHAALMWASSIEPLARNLPSLVKTDVPAKEDKTAVPVEENPLSDLPDFFWKHLQCDLEVIKKATNKSGDDSLLLIHLILKDICTLDPGQSVAAIDSSLSTKQGRTEWEGTFDQVYIQPTLQEGEKRIKDAIQALAGATKAIPVAYEQTEVPAGILAPHLWVFRSHITLDHLALVLQHKNLKSQHPHLYEFLSKEPILRATQYLPDIVKLQWYLHDKFDQRVDHREAATLTFGKFLETTIQHDHVRNEYAKVADSLQKAWKLVREKLQETARLRIEDEHLIPAISEDTPLEYLIPTTSGPGLCTTALVDALVLTHNNFIKHCQEIVNKQRRTQGRLEWMLHKVPITRIHRCHLLDYEQQILSVVLSHCHYSLKVGQAAEDIQYDLPALEKHFLNRFIHGKPVILLDIPQVVYHKDVCTAANFATVRNKVPQEVLAPRIRQEILAELHSVENLRSSLDVVDIVLGFLASSGGNPKKLLRDYIKKTLKMDDKYKSFSKRACDYCTLAHVMSLWEALSVEIARRITLNDQEPFDSFPEAFRMPLTEEQEMGLQVVLRSFTIDQLLGTLYEFIETYTKTAPEEHSGEGWELVYLLDPYLQQNGLPIIDKFAEEFPNTITLGQTIAAWKFVVRYQEKQKE